MEKFIKKATEFLASKTDVKSVCLTSDGSVFLLESFLFADSHSQNLKDQTIIVLTESKKDVEQLNSKFFEGSKWKLNLIKKEVKKPTPKTTTKKKEVKNEKK